MLVVLLSLREAMMSFTLVRKWKFWIKLTEALQPLRQIFNELKRQKQQLSITMFIHKVKKKNVHYRRPSAIKDHLRLTSSSRHCFRLLSLLHLLQKIILMTLLPFRQKINSQAKSNNACTIIAGIVLSSYHRRHRHHHHHHHHHHHQWSSQQQEEWKSMIFIVLSSLETVHDAAQVLHLITAVSSLED